jgi:hypothetical protein
LTPPVPGLLPPVPLLPPEAAGALGPAGDVQANDDSASSSPATPVETFDFFKDSSRRSAGTPAEK